MVGFLLLYWGIIISVTESVCVHGGHGWFYTKGFSIIESPGMHNGSSACEYAHVFILLLSGHGDTMENCSLYYRKLSRNSLV